MNKKICENEIKLKTFLKKLERQRKRTKKKLKKCEKG